MGNALKARPQRLLDHLRRPLPSGRDLLTSNAGHTVSEIVPREYPFGMDRITVDPKVMGGVPCIRGLRIPVATVVNMIAGGMTPDQIVDELPPLEAEDVAAALRFAADAVADREIPLLPSA